ncbi:diacylglycerol kinase [Dasania marina]|uniref:diacylglycerol kinase n=1 Tax=Dasania marina TaxID=471499 RepID=UPI0030DCE92A|tara:strand:- start:38905 stop:39270 length:366 start_codon:yes stop_codon:yes gene_type:complete
MFDNKNKPKGLRRIYFASLNSFRAFKWLYFNESAFKQEILLLLLVIPCTFIFSISGKEQILLILSIVFIIFTEILNTAIEAVVDRIGLEINPLSGLAKDLGSASVLVSILMAVAIWLIILL